MFDAGSDVCVLLLLKRWREYVDVIWNVQAFSS